MFHVNSSFHAQDIQLSMFLFIFLWAQRWFKVNVIFSYTIRWLSIQGTHASHPCSWISFYYHWISDVSRLHRSSTEINILFLEIICEWISSLSPIKSLKQQRSNVDMDIQADTAKRWVACYCRDRYEIFEEINKSDKVAVSWIIVNKWKLSRFQSGVELW